MRIALSNIAWEPPEDVAVAALLQRHGVDAIDIAPGKYFPVLSAATDADIHRVGDWWRERGIEITGMQALLFGTQGLNVFGPPPVQEALLAHLGEVSRIAGRLGATRLVFGSPKNRDRSGIDDADTRERAINFFNRLGDIAAANGVIFCLEPNPPCYGANFMIDSTETAAVVKAVNHRSIFMQLDTGALTINGENAAATVAACAPLIGHIHASEPDLVPIGDGCTDHAAAAAAIAATLPHHLVTIEMVATKNEPHLVSIERALGVTVANYRNALAAAEVTA